MKVVLGADGSDHAEYAARFLTKYPLGEDSVVDCCGVYSAAHVVTATAHPFLGPLLADHLSGAVDDAKEAAQKGAKDAATLVRDLGLASEAHLLEGDPADELAGYAESVGAGFVAVGSRGHGALDTILLGSVAREIANNHTVNLLVTRKKDDLPPDGLRVVFATDHSDYAETVTQKLKALVKGKFAEFEVFSVVDPDSKDVTFARSTTAWDDLQSGLSGWAEEQNQATLEELGDIAAVTTSAVEVGSARQAIVERTKGDRADLLIIGAQGRSALSRLLLGSVSNFVLSRATCSVMIVRA